MKATSFAPLSIIFRIFVAEIKERIRLLMSEKVKTLEHDEADKKSDLPTKARKAPTKKNAERNNTRYLVYLRKTRRARLLSRIRRSFSHPFGQPLCITISTEGLTQEQIDYLKELEAKGLVPQITWIESRPRGLDDKLKYALVYLHSDEARTQGCKIIKGYDYAWIKLAIDCKRMPERYDKYKFMSTPKFVEYFKSLGFTDIAGSKTINKLLINARWHLDDNTITFRHIYVSPSERQRRNLIALKFLELMNEI